MITLPRFQFTHPGGVRLLRIWGRFSTKSFNSRTREGCDLVSSSSDTAGLQFQFTHPGGVRRRQSLGIRPNHIRFNSRTREGCDKPERTLSGRLKVSIHAPGRGATILPLMVELLRRVSIHAPGRGATKSHRRQELIQRSFNSRTREGCDSLWCRRSPWPRCFNSRTREGCDPFSGPSVILIYGFQFTHPGGVRRLLLSLRIRQSCGFNSRTREGCDKPERTLSGRLKVSIHAPGRGATSFNFLRFTRSSGFNSRTREGCDLTLIKCNYYATYCFNSRTREGCDVRETLQAGDRDPVSIHAPGRGATQAHLQARRRSAVSIHAPGRGAT